MNASALPPPPPPTPPDAEDSGRSLQPWIWVGGISAAIGLVVVVAWVGFQFVQMSNDVDRLIRTGPTAQSSSEFVVDEPVDWTLFIEPNEASLTGVRLRVWDVDAGEEVTLKPYDGSFSYGFPAHSGRALATVQLDPGTYSLQTEGAPIGLAIGPSPAGRLFMMLLVGLAIGLPFVGGGTAMAVVAALRESRRRNRSAAMPPQSDWSTGEWPTDGR